MLVHRIESANLEFNKYEIRHKKLRVRNQKQEISNHKRRHDLNEDDIIKLNQTQNQIIYEKSKQDPHRMLNRILLKSCTGFSWNSEQNSLEILTRIL